MSWPMESPVLQNFWIGTDFTKLLSSLPTPNEAAKALIEAQLKNIHALEAANQHAIEAFHAVFACQNEILHSSMAEIAKALSEAPPKDAAEALDKQRDMALATTERTLDSLREISEIIAGASEQAREKISHRIQEGLDELHAIGRKK